MAVPRVVPRHSDINYLQCQTSPTAIPGAKGIFLDCQTGKSQRARLALPDDGSYFCNRCDQSHSDTLRGGLPAATTPICSSACAARKAISSRQGAAMI